MSGGGVFARQSEACAESGVGGARRTVRRSTPGAGSLGAATSRSARRWGSGPGSPGHACACRAAATAFGRGKRRNGPLGAFGPEPAQPRSNRRNESQEAASLRGLRRNGERGWTESRARDGSGLAGSTGRRPWASRRRGRGVGGRGGRKRRRGLLVGVHQEIIFGTVAFFDWNIGGCAAGLGATHGSCASGLDATAEDRGKPRNRCGNWRFGAWGVVGGRTLPSAASPSLEVGRAGAGGGRKSAPRFRREAGKPARGPGAGGRVEGRRLRAARCSRQRRGGAVVPGRRDAGSRTGAASRLPVLEEEVHAAVGPLDPAAGVLFEAVQKIVEANEVGDAHWCGSRGVCGHDSNSCFSHRSRLPIGMSFMGSWTAMPRSCSAGTTNSW